MPSNSQNTISCFIYDLTHCRTPHTYGFCFYFYFYFLFPLLCVYHNKTMLRARAHTNSHLVSLFSFECRLRTTISMERVFNAYRVWCVYLSVCPAHTITSHLGNFQHTTIQPNGMAPFMSKCECACVCVWVFMCIASIFFLLLLSIVSYTREIGFCTLYLPSPHRTFSFVSFRRRKKNRYLCTGGTHTYADAHCSASQIVCSNFGLLGTHRVYIWMFVPLNNLVDVCLRSQIDGVCDQVVIVQICILFLLHYFSSPNTVSTFYIRLHWVFTRIIVFIHWVKRRIKQLVISWCTEMHTIGLQFRWSALNEFCKFQFDSTAIERQKIHSKCIAHRPIFTI